MHEDPERRILFHPVSIHQRTSPTTSGSLADNGMTVRKARGNVRRIVAWRRLSPIQLGPVPWHAAPDRPRPDAMINEARDRQVLDYSGRYSRSWWVESE